MIKAVLTWQLQKYLALTPPPPPFVGFFGRVAEKAKKVVEFRTCIKNRPLAFWVLLGRINRTFDYSLRACHQIAPSNQNVPPPLFWPIVDFLCWKYGVESSHRIFFASFQHGQLVA
jgi:hypothetical protein